MTLRQLFDLYVHESPLNLYQLSHPSVPNPRTPSISSPCSPAKYSQSLKPAILSQHYTLTMAADLLLLVLWITLILTLVETFRMSKSLEPAPTMTKATVHSSVDKNDNRRNITAARTISAARTVRRRYYQRPVPVPKWMRARTRGTSHRLSTTSQCRQQQLALCCQSLRLSDRTPVNWVGSREEMWVGCCTNRAEQWSMGPAPEFCKEEDDIGESSLCSGRGCA